MFISSYQMLQSHEKQQFQAFHSFENYLWSMEILVVAATSAEIDPLIQALHLNLNQYQKTDHYSVKPLITGVGLMHTAFALQAELHAHRPDFVLNVGIAGSFDPEIQLAQAVFVQKEFPGDFGALAPEGFLPAASIGLLQADEFPYTEAGIVADVPFFKHDDLFKANSITVQQVSGTKESIRSMRETWPNAHIENMEGLAVYYVSKMMQVPCAAVRTISNRVEPRNRNNWKLKEAIAALNDLLMKLFSN
jgi:futalosine hydrolase